MPRMHLQRLAKIGFQQALVSTGSGSPSRSASVFRALADLQLAAQELAVQQSVAIAFGIRANSFASQHSA